MDHRPSTTAQRTCRHWLAAKAVGFIAFFVLATLYVAPAGTRLLRSHGAATTSELAHTSKTAAHEGCSSSGNISEQGGPALGSLFTDLPQRFVSFKRRLQQRSLLPILTVLVRRFYAEPNLQLHTSAPKTRFPTPRLLSQLFLIFCCLRP